MKPKPKLDPVLVKAEEDSEEEDMDQKKGKDEPEDEAEEEAAKEEKAEKSEDLTEDDLEKSIEKLAALASVADAPTRKETLLKKGLAEDLSKAETAELFDLMGDKQAPEASLSDEITKSMDGNETIAKALDVSEYLS